VLKIQLNPVTFTVFGNGSHIIARQLSAEPSDAHARTGGVAHLLRNASYCWSLLLHRGVFSPCLRTTWRLTLSFS
jgi:hypothetical protein